jgi:FAD/FMN-containing dehydrogenase
LLRTLSIGTSTGALNGGGGGTYGIAVSITVKLHEPWVVAAATLSFAQPTTENGKQSFWDVVTLIVHSARSVADAKLEVI